MGCVRARAFLLDSSRSINARYGSSYGQVVEAGLRPPTRYAMPPVGHHLRPRAIGLYKELHRLGRDYPDPKYNFLGKLRGMFGKFAQLTEDKEVEEKLKLGEYIRDETKAMYSLKKYRTLRRRYIGND